MYIHIGTYTCRAARFPTAQRVLSPRIQDMAANAVLGDPHEYYS